MMKATRDDQRSLIDLASIDRELGKLNHTLSSLAVYAELEDAESVLGVHMKQAAERASRKPALESAIADCGVRVEKLNSSIARKQGQLDSGENMDSRQLLVLQGEIDGLKESRDEIELAELDAMQELETLDEEIAADNEETARLSGVRDALIERRDREVAELGAQIDEVQSRRRSAAAAIAQPVVAAYEESRAMGGSGVVIMNADGTVDGGLDLSVTEIERIRALPDDEVYLTEDTGAVVIRA